MDDRAYLPYLPDDPALAYATTSSGYLGHRLTGAFRDSAANSILLQWPIDVDRWDWSNDAALFEQFRLRRELLFELQLPGEVIGNVTAAAADGDRDPGRPSRRLDRERQGRRGARRAGPLGADGTALVSLGTYIAAMVPGRENHAAPASFWTNFGCIPHRYLYESHGVRRGMWTLSWFLDLLGPELSERAATLGVSREELIEDEAASVPAGSDGLMSVLDWLAPTEAPFRKGVMLGFDARHTRAHVYRSIVEAIALTMKHNVAAMAGELGITLEEIVISGGGASSPLFMQTFADVFGLPATRSSGAAGASLGAAICAASAAGIYPDIETAAARMTSEREAFAPDPGNTAIYERMNETVYQAIRAATDPLLERSFPIFH